MNHTQSTGMLLSGCFAFENARMIMENHDNLNLCLQTTPMEDLHKEYVSCLSPKKYNDLSAAYRGSKSLANVLSEPQQQALQQKRRCGRDP